MESYIILYIILICFEYYIDVITSIHQTNIALQFKYNLNFYHSFIFILIQLQIYFNTYIKVL